MGFHIYTKQVVFTAERAYIRLLYLENALYKRFKYFTVYSAKPRLNTIKFLSKYCCALDVGDL